MQRSTSAPLAVVLLASIIVLGCGGGGGKKPSTSGGTTATVPTGVVRDPFGTLLVGARVTYYDEGGTALSSGSVGSDGLIPNPVPSSATRFGVDPTPASSAPFYLTFLYDGLYYDASLGCYARLPSQGSREGFNTDVVFFEQGSGTVPPAPTGCTINP